MYLWYYLGCISLLRHIPLYDFIKDKIWPLCRLLFLPIISSLQFSVIKKVQLQIWIRKATLEITREHNVAILGTILNSYYDRFFGVLAARIRESSDKQVVLRIVKTLPFIHQPDRVAPKASDVSAADWLYQHTWKNTIFFHVCCYGFS